LSTNWDDKTQYLTTDQRQNVKGRLIKGFNTLKKRIKYKGKTAKNLNVKRKRQSSDKTSNGILRKSPRRMSVRIKRQKNLTLKSTKSI
jgi:hypothetical protein